jgi:hypothetical protein
VFVAILRLSDFVGLAYALSTSFKIDNASIFFVIHGTNFSRASNLYLLLSLRALLIIVGRLSLGTYQSGVFLKNIFCNSFLFVISSDHAASNSLIQGTDFTSESKRFLRDNAS